MTNQEAQSAIDLLKTIKILKFEDESQKYFFSDVEKAIELAIEALDTCS